MRRVSAAVALALGVFINSQAHATIVNEWNSIQPPAPPVLKQVHVDPKTTTLLVLDFMNSNCGVKPRCIATEPGMAALVKEAEAAHATVIYSFTRGKTAKDVVKPLQPKPGIPSVVAGPDKFLGTNLDTLLKAAGTKTVIVTGTAAEGAVLATASQAAYRGMKVILPVDGMSSGSAYAEQAVAYIMTNGPTTGAQTTPTSLAQIYFDGQ
jgi:nicotinamidase-related amidase